MLATCKWPICLPNLRRLPAMTWIAQGIVGCCCGGGGASMAGRIASNRFDFSLRLFSHLRVAATRRAQCTEQKRPEPYDLSCGFEQLSHGLSTSGGWHLRWRWYGGAGCAAEAAAATVRRDAGEDADAEEGACAADAREAHLCRAPTFLAHVAEQKRPEPYVP